MAEILCCAIGWHQSTQVMPTAEQSPLCFLALRSHHGLAPGSGLGKVTRGSYNKSYRGKGGGRRWHIKQGVITIIIHKNRNPLDARH